MEHEPDLQPGTCRGVLNMHFHTYYIHDFKELLIHTHLENAENCRDHK